MLLATLALSPLAKSVASDSDGAESADGGIFEDIELFWNSLAKSGLERWLGHNVTEGEYKSKIDIQDAAAVACDNSERLINQGKDREALIALNKCRLLGLKVRFAPAVIRAMALLGEVHQAQGKQAKALKDFQSTLLASRQLRLGRFESRALTGISILNFQYGDPESAAATFQKLKPAIRELKFTENKDLTPQLAVRVLYLRIMSAVANVETRASAGLLSPILEDLKPKLAHSDLLYYWHAKAAVAFSADEFDETLRAANQGLEVLGSVLASNAEHSRGRIWKMHLAELKGRALRKKSPSDAIAALELARESFYVVRSEIFGSPRASALTRQHEPLFEELIDAYLAVGKQEEALKVAVDFKNLDLGDRLAIQSIGFNETVEEAFRSMTSEAYRKFLSAGGIEKKASVKDATLSEAAATDANKKAAEAFLARPMVMASLFPHASSHADIEIFRAALGEQTAYLDFVMLAKSVKVFVATRRGMHVVDLPVDRGWLARESERLHLAFSNPDAVIPQALMREVFDKLLRPVLLKTPEAKELVISAHGPVSAVPFGALHDGKAYVSDQMSVLHTARFALTNPEASGSLQGFAASVVWFHLPNETVSIGATQNRTVAASANAVAATTKLLRMSRDNPQKANVLDAIVSQKDSNAFHLSFPATYDAGNPFATGFAGVHKDNLGLRLFEFLDLKAGNAKLMVFDRMRAYGTDGFDRDGFQSIVMSCGVESVVTTEWDVHKSSAVGSDAPAMFYDKFYREMAAGTSRPEALRRAQVAVRQVAAFAHPHYWAGYRLAGGFKQ